MKRDRRFVGLVLLLVFGFGVWIGTALGQRWGQPTAVTPASGIRSAGVGVCIEVIGDTMRIVNWTSSHVALSFAASAPGAMSANLPPNGGMMFSGPLWIGFTPAALP